MEVLSTGTDKVAAQIQDYKEYHTDTTVRFVVHMSQVNYQSFFRDGESSFTAYRKRSY